MLGTRKSMSNLLQSAEGPFLIHVRYWFETKFREGSFIKIQFGKRTPITIKSYVPGDKYVILDVASRSCMPVCRIEAADSSLDIDLKKYQPGNSREHTALIGKVKIVFTLQLLSNTEEISALYASDKVTEEQKFRYADSVNDLIRSEAEFLSKFERIQEVQEIKKMEKAENEVEERLSKQLAAVKWIDINLKHLVLILVLFFAIGYLLTSDPGRKRHRKKAKKSKTL